MCEVIGLKLGITFIVFFTNLSGHVSSTFHPLDAELVFPYFVLIEPELRLKLSCKKPVDQQIFESHSQYAPCLMLWLMPKLNQQNFAAWKWAKR